LPEQSPAVTEGVEINVPNVQREGEAEGSALHLGALENITPIRTTLQNAADHSDTPSSSQNQKRRECDENTDDLETSLKEAPLHRLQKPPHIDYQLLDDPYGNDIHQSMPTSNHIMCAAYESTDRDEPKTLKVARQSPDWPEWEKAINSEPEQLTHMGTWQLTAKPANALLIANKWVFIKKFNKAGDLIKYKA
jgi:hypothetical protein